MRRARYVTAEGSANVENVFVMQSLNWNPSTIPDDSVNAVITTATITKENCVEVCRRVLRDFRLIRDLLMSVI